MKTIKIEESKQKRTYTKPQVVQIKLDNEISLVMMSDPPVDPWTSVPSEHNNANPFKMA